VSFFFEQKQENILNKRYFSQILRLFYSKPIHNFTLFFFFSVLIKYVHHIWILKAIKYLKLYLLFQDFKTKNVFDLGSRILFILKNLKILKDIISHIEKKVMIRKLFVDFASCLLGYFVTELIIRLNWLTRRILLVSPYCWWRFKTISWKFCVKKTKIMIETKLKLKHLVFVKTNNFDFSPRYHFIKMTIIPNQRAFVDFRPQVFYDDIIKSSTLSTLFCVALWCKFF
jgi:hypothetical protein